MKNGNLKCLRQFKLTQLRLNVVESAKLFMSAGRILPTDIIFTYGLDNTPSP